MMHSMTEISKANPEANKGAGSLHSPSAARVDDAARIAQLETENSRLQQLVAELLIKNHQLRKPDLP
jgi:hypothetical protein